MSLMGYCINGCYVYTSKYLYKCPIYVPKMLDIPCPVVIGYPIGRPVPLGLHTRKENMEHVYQHQASTGVRLL